MVPLTRRSPLCRALPRTDPDEPTDRASDRNMILRAWRCFAGLGKKHEAARPDNAGAAKTPDLIASFRV